MKKSMKALSTAALAVTCLLGGCGSTSKSIDFEKNYEAAKAAALSINNVEESTEGFFVSMEMDMNMKMNYEGMNLDMDINMSLWINHVGDDYYMESVTSALGEEEIVGAAVVKGQDNNFTGYSWQPDYYAEGGMSYTKTALGAADIEEFEDMFSSDTTDMGIVDVFLGDYANIETAMKATILELIEDDTFSEFPIDLEGDMNNLVITKSATQKGDKKTLKVTAKLPASQNEELTITFGIVLDGDNFDSLILEMSGKGTVDGSTMEFSAKVTQKIELEGRTDSKYASVPNVEWVNGGLGM